MMNKKDFLKSQKEYAEMLGMTLEEYEKDCQNTTILSKKHFPKKKGIEKYDNSILKKLGLTPKDLMTRRI